MATSFPTSIDNFTNPTGTDNTNAAIGGRTHAQFHADMNDAMEAVQTLLGANGANVVRKDISGYDSGWQDLTLLNGFTASESGVNKYRRINGIVYLSWTINHPATITTNVPFILPAGYRPAFIIRAGAYTPWGDTSGSSIDISTSGTATVSTSTTGETWNAGYVTFPADN